MLISICIPQYNRSKYLLAVLESIRIQDYPEVEVVISDDCSSDDTLEVIPKYIAEVQGSTHVRFKYIRQAKNLGYDGNLRAALGAAEGEYLFTLGNDDALPAAHTLSKLASILEQLNYPDVSFTNFHYYGKPEQVERRARATSVIGSGPEVALQTFRSFSFVGGMVIKNDVFRQHNTDKYDGSVYFQIYLAARIAASGGTLASISESMVAKDVSFPGETVNSYLDILAEKNQTLHREFGGLDQVGIVASEAILPYVPTAYRQRHIRKIYQQLLLFPYPYWLLVYRRQGVYRAAVNLSLGCFPTSLMKIPDVSLFVYFQLIVVFAGSSLVGLMVPVGMLEKLAKSLRHFSKRVKAEPEYLKPGTELRAS